MTTVKKKPLSAAVRWVTLLLALTGLKAVVCNRHALWSDWSNRSDWSGNAPAGTGAVVPAEAGEMEAARWTHLRYLVAALEQLMRLHGVKSFTPLATGEDEQVEVYLRWDGEVAVPCNVIHWRDDARARPVVVCGEPFPDPAE